MKYLISLIIISMLYSCGSYKVTELRRISKHYYVTSDNDTLKANKPMIKAIGDGGYFGVWHRGGKIKDGKFINQNKND